MLDITDHTSFPCANHTIKNCLCTLVLFRNVSHNKLSCFLDNKNSVHR